MFLVFENLSNAYKTVKNKLPEKSAMNFARE